MSVRYSNSVSWLLSFLFKLCSYSYKKFLHLTKKYQAHQSVSYVIVPARTPLLLELSTRNPRKIMVLDLDETLIHSVCDGSIQRPGTEDWPADFIIRVNIDLHPVRFFVHKRPHVDLFLDLVSQWYDLVIYTASLEKYGSSVVDELDAGRRILQRRYYRQHCQFVCGSYRKDLSIICSDLSSIFIIDNSPNAYVDFPYNAIPVKTWFSSPKDTGLLDLLPFLDAMRFTRDVRSILCRNLHQRGHTPLRQWEKEKKITKK